MFETITPTPAAPTAPVVIGVDTAAPGADQTVASTVTVAPVVPTVSTAAPTAPTEHPAHGLLGEIESEISVIDVEIRARVKALILKIRASL